MIQQEEHYKCFLPPFFFFYKRGFSGSGRACFFLRFSGNTSWLAFKSSSTCRRSFTTIATRPTKNYVLGD